MNAFLQVAGLAILLHIGACVFVLLAINSPDVATQLFAVPNNWLGPPPAIRLMRVRFYWPFVSLPSEVRMLESRTRAMIFVARLTGLGFFCSMFGFFVAAFVEAAA